MPEQTYKIVRVFEAHDFRELIATGLTLAEAQEHCSDPETSSSTARDPDNVSRTREFGDWMECFYRED